MPRILALGRFAGTVLLSQNQDRPTKCPSLTTNGIPCQSIGTIGTIGAVAGSRDTPLLGNKYKLFKIQFGEGQLQ